MCKVLLLVALVANTIFIVASECNGDPNAVGPGCGNHCGKQCSDWNRTVICTQECPGGCDCKKGYVYDANTGRCVLPERCTPTCDGPHEYYKCWIACDNLCSKYSYENQDNCPYINVKCNDMCYCDKGYARLNNGTCVPIDYCRRCKQPHEYYDCIPLCFNESCSPNPGGPICNIQTTDAVPCNARCRCEDGYCRDKSGECIPKIIPLK